MHIVSRLPSDPAPRIGALSVLPVFLDLTGKRAVVVGGSEAAAWKVELLVSAGANVDLYAGELSEGMEEVAVRHPAIRHFPRSWRAGDLNGAAVALCDAEHDVEAVAFEQAAREAGVPCNIIDRPEYCHFQFGTIVNRSPVVVGISTSGAAPVLGQAIRRRIETLLPPTLAGWAGLARDWRRRVAEALPVGPARRRFWERFVDRAFGPAADETSEASLLGGLQDIESRGHVTFVGAGPGDAELITLKAIRALQAADVILFDDLVSDEVLELARREAKRILVGKRAGRASCKQHEINDLMVKLANAGRRVVRLKSGDPMIFGRAGEEIAELERHGIGYDVVPGVTAGLALAATLGVSLTHRDKARSVRFITGHSQHGGLPDDIDWMAIADPSTTTIFYMGGRTASSIASLLISHGMPPETPVVIAADIGRIGETKLCCDLADLSKGINTLLNGGPVVIGIGSVFAERRADPATVMAAGSSWTDEFGDTCPQVSFERRAALQTIVQIDRVT
ncbi:siroheme synthase CysG [Neoaquamicrobium sediminum]|uniref:Siroheme synthase CysG n=1 Tax=Neoaquamicrobium sediminum TaxID=1849104 RepID=A0ABV3X0R5_9HYPH|nr:siroheme synthase CysG [Mesorhizobium sediminum]NRC56343.1 uroporphyrinogen-III C-methyltransferase [Mesorhizobium sediminum]